MPDWRQLLISELVFDKTQLVDVKDDTSLEVALEILDHFKIRSVPVYQIDPRYSQKQYLGFLDSLDVAHYLGYITQLESSTGTGDTPLDQKLKISVKDFFEWQRQNCNIQGKDFYIFDPVIRLGELIKVITKNPQERVHRVLVRQQGSLEDPLQHRILTETDLIEFFIDNLPKPFLDTKVENLQLATLIGSQVPFLKSSSSAIEAFQKMYKDKVSALPILDEDFKLITTISSADAKSLRAMNIDDMFQPVLAYLKKRFKGQSICPITCVTSESLGDVLLKCSRVHRVWVIDSSDKVIGVISQTDVIRCIDLHSPEKQ